jgi:FdhD protein
MESAGAEAGRMTDPIAVRTLVRFVATTGASMPDQDLVAAESPLTVHVQPPDGPSRSLGLLMRTPGHDEDLALGALFAEGLIDSMAAVRAVHTRRVDDADEVTVDVTSAAAVAAMVGRGSTSTSACGLCGRLEVIALATAPALVQGTETPMVTAPTVHALPDRLRAAQAAFAETGGLHAAGVFTREGALRLVREDVGRHNAVDKVIGALLREGAVPATESLLVVSGRVAYEIVQKAARAGIPLILAVGAPTDLAVDAARAAGITLAGFVREGRFNVYTWPGRIGNYSP